MRDVSVAEIVSRVEIQMNYTFDPEEVMRILSYSKRKAALAGKGEDYVPILYENELHDFIIRERISLSCFEGVLR